MESFDLANWHNWAPGEWVNVYAGGIQQFGQWEGPITASGIHFNFNLTSTAQVEIDFGPNWDPAIDNITFTGTPVPEPTTFIAGGLALLPVGATTLRFLRRNRKQTA